MRLRVELELIRGTISSFKQSVRTGLASPAAFGCRERHHSKRVGCRALQKRDALKALPRVATCWPVRDWIKPLGGSTRAKLLHILPHKREWQHNGELKKTEAQ